LSLLVLAVAAAFAQAPPSAPPPPPLPGFVPPYEVSKTVRAAGFTPLAPPRREGTTYVIRATDLRGTLMRVVVDARSGAIRAANRIVQPPPGYSVAGILPSAYDEPSYGRPPPGYGPLAGYGPPPDMPPPDMGPMGPMGPAEAELAPGPGMGPPPPYPSYPPPPSSVIRPGSMTPGAALPPLPRPRPPELAAREVKPAPKPVEAPAARPDAAPNASAAPPSPASPAVAPKRPPQPAIPD
jgi:hypothetical protein